jgi:phage tail-like protein
MRIFSAQYLDMEKSIKLLPMTFDPKVAAAGTLRWLARLIHIPHEELWETERLRELLLRRTYVRKGTLNGLSELVELFTGFKPYIAERHLMKSGDPTLDMQYRNHAVHIMLPPEAAGATPPVSAIRKVVDSFMPEGISYAVRFMNEGARVGDHSYVGLNTRVVKKRTATLGRNARVGHIVVGE